MTLTLRLIHPYRLEEGWPTRLVLNGHGGVIGRSPHADWSLPDPEKLVSGSHCEIEYRDGAYVLIDRSTNGTFLNGAEARMTAPHILASGDIILIGRFRIEARLAEVTGAIRAGRFDEVAPDPFAELVAAFHAGLAAFAPEALRQHAEGLPPKILPALREAALWNAYERGYDARREEAEAAFLAALKAAGVRPDGDR